MTTLEILQDSVIQSARRRRESVRVGPFEAFFDPDPMVWLNLAMPVAQPVHEEEVRASLVQLAHVFRMRERVLRFEFFEGLWQGLPEVLEEFGLVCHARQQILACGPGDERIPTGISPEIARIVEHDSDDTLKEFLHLAMRCFTCDDAPEPKPEEIERLRGDIFKGNVIACIGWMDGEMASVGSALPAGKAAEIAGIGTLPQFRRRGLAKAITAELARLVFEEGGHLVWLTAGDAGAGRVYKNAGFRELPSVQLNYIDGSWQGLKDIMG